MLTAVIDARSGPLALAATLGPLVRGVVEGMVGTALIVSPRADAEIAAIADASGCRVLVEESWTGGFARAVTNASGSGILVLDAGIMLGPDFWPLLADTLPLIGNRAAATEPARRAGLLAPFRTMLGGLGGRISRDSALLLPPSRAREIALAKADPFQMRLGKACVRLRTMVTRVDLG